MNAQDRIKLDRIEESGELTEAERREIAAIYEREDAAEEARRQAVNWWEVV